MEHGRGLDLNVARRIDSWVGTLICGSLFGLNYLASLFGGRRLPPTWATTPPRMGEDSPSPGRILAIRFYGLGNIVMLLPVLQALRDAHPHAEVDFLTLGDNRELLERSGLINRVIGLNLGNYGTFLRDLWSACRAIRAGRYDVVIDFEQFIKLSAILAFISRAPETIGFNTDGTRRGWLFSRRVVYVDHEHTSRTFMRLLRVIGADGAFRPVRLASSAEEEDMVSSFLSGNGTGGDASPVVAVHVGSGANFYKTALKRWAPGRFAALCDSLVERHGVRIVLTGKGEDERGLVETTMRAMRYRALNGCDRLSLGELIALLVRCRFLVTNDTSVMHLAVLLGTPVAAIFGPTSPVQYGPSNPGDLVFSRDLYCSPCLTNYNYKTSRCDNPVCMDTIAVDEVLKGIEERFFGGEVRSGSVASAAPPVDQRAAT